MFSLGRQESMQEVLAIFMTLSFEIIHILLDHQKMPHEEKHKLQCL